MEAPLKSSWQLEDLGVPRSGKQKPCPGVRPQRGGRPPSSFPLRGWRYFISQTRDEASEAIPFSPRAGNQTPTPCDTEKRGRRSPGGQYDGAGGGVGRLIFEKGY